MEEEMEGIRRGSEGSDWLPFVLLPDVVLFAQVDKVSYGFGG